MMMKAIVQCVQKLLARPSISFDWEVLEISSFWPKIILKISKNDQISEPDQNFRTHCIKTVPRSGATWTATRNTRKCVKIWSVRRRVGEATGTRKSVWTVDLVKLAQWNRWWKLVILTGKNGICWRKSSILWSNKPELIVLKRETSCKEARWSHSPIFWEVSWTRVNVRCAISITTFWSAGTLVRFTKSWGWKEGQPSTNTTCTGWFVEMYDLGWIPDFRVVRSFSIVISGDLKSLILGHFKSFKGLSGHSRSFQVISVYSRYFSSFWLILSHYVKPPFTL